MLPAQMHRLTREIQTTARAFTQIPFPLLQIGVIYAICGYNSPFR
jgi:hypothetical protein